jgi:clan AA aspartic protease
MNGHVDKAGRSLISVPVKTPSQASSASVAFWIDTGFTGEVALPQSTISNLHLSQSGTVDAELADGSPVTLATYTCLVDWFGKERTVQAVATSGSDALLGVGLLRERILTVDYRAETVAVQ